jgi:hypothetical protein
MRDHASSVPGVNARCSRHRGARHVVAGPTRRRIMFYLKSNEVMRGGNVVPDETLMITKCDLAIHRAKRANFCRRTLHLRCLQRFVMR